MSTVVTIFSGGMDSTVLLYKLKSDGYDIKALSVNYGQRHKKELESAKTICQLLEIEHQIADLSSITHLLAGSSQTNSEVAVPHGHYEEESMKLTVVPNRNLLMLSIAMSWAISLKADAVAYGAHAGDRAIYPDCKIEFINKAAEIAKLVDWHQLELFAPFVNITKGQIVELGHKLGVPFELTWTCYEGGNIACGKCSTDVERLEAFDQAGIEDPLEYQDREFWRKVIADHV